MVGRDGYKFKLYLPILNIYFYISYHRIQIINFACFNEYFAVLYLIDTYYNSMYIDV